MKRILLVFTILLSNNIWSQEIVVENPEAVNGDTVPFAVIEDLPVFPGCEEMERKER